MRTDTVPADPPPDPAAELAALLLGLPERLRRVELARLAVDNPALHLLVRDRLGRTHLG